MINEKEMINIIEQAKIDSGYYDRNPFLIPMLIGFACIPALFLYIQVLK